MKTFRYLAGILLCLVILQCATVPLAGRNITAEMNAWCMPGEKIASYEGIMPVCNNETGVAVVMSHAIANHGNERMSQQLAVQLGGMALDVALTNKPEETRQLALTAGNTKAKPMNWVCILCPRAKPYRR